MSSVGREANSTAKELLTQVDKPIYAYREFLERFDKKGWRIDRKKFEQERGDIAFAIPSPARREEKNWILDTIPLKQPS